MAEETAGPSVGKSVRASIEKLSGETPAAEIPAAEVPVKEVADETPKPAEGKAERARDGSGKFAKAEDKKPAAPSGELPAPKKADPPVLAPVEAPPAEPAKPALKAPAGVKPELRAKFSELPPEWQTEIDRLNREASKRIQQTSELANFGQALSQECAPYEAMIRAEGGTPQTAIRDLLRTAYTLRQGTPAQKQQMILQVAHQFGVDMQGLVAGMQQGHFPQVDPNVSALQQRIDAMERQSQQQQHQQQQALTTQVQTELESFANDSANEYYEDVRAHMAALIQSGAANDLQDAYDQACWANPVIRASLIERQNKDAETKRRADEAKAVEAKKRAGVSIHGAPASPITAAAGNESVRQTIARVTSQAAGRI